MMIRKFSGLPRFVMFGVAALILLFSAADVAAGECTATELEEHKCFKTTSGYSIRIVDQTGEQCGTAFTVTGFPTDLGTENAYGWCYEIFAPALKIGSISHINLQIPLSFYEPNPPYASALVLPSSIYTPFSYTAANGCLGDSTTGFEVGDRDDCGLKWTLRVNPTGTASRFYYKSKKQYANGSLVPFETGVKIMAPKVGNVLEPGYILGARSILGAPAYTPEGKYSCQLIEGDGNYYKITLNDYGCPTALDNCGQAKDCSSGCVPVATTDLKVRFVKKSNFDPNNPGGAEDINPKWQGFHTLREIGDLFGNRLCPSGHMVTTGSICTTYYIGGRLTQLCR